MDRERMWIFESYIERKKYELLKLIVEGKKEAEIYDVEDFY